MKLHRSGLRSAFFWSSDRIAWLVLKKVTYTFWYLAKFESHFRAGNHQPVGRYRKGSSVMAQTKDLSA